MDFRFELPLAPESLALLPGRVKRIWRWPFAGQGGLLAVLRSRSVTRDP